MSDVSDDLAHSHGEAEHETIVSALDIETLDTNLYRSKSLWLPSEARGVFGGYVGFIPSLRHTRNGLMSSTRHTKIIDGRLGAPRLGRPRPSPHSDLLPAIEAPSPPLTSLRPERSVPASRAPLALPDGSPLISSHLSPPHRLQAGHLPGPHRCDKICSGTICRSCQ